MSEAGGSRQKEIMKQIRELQRQVKGEVFELPSDTESDSESESSESLRSSEKSELTEEDSEAEGEAAEEEVDTRDLQKAFERALTEKSVTGLSEEAARQLWASENGIPVSTILNSFERGQLIFGNVSGYMSRPEQGKFPIRGKNQNMRNPYQQMLTAPCKGSLQNGTHNYNLFPISPGQMVEFLASEVYFATSKMAVVGNMTNTSGKSRTKLLTHTAEMQVELLQYIQEVRLLLGQLGLTTEFSARQTDANWLVKYGLTFLFVIGRYQFCINRKEKKGDLCKNFAASATVHVFDKIAYLERSGSEETKIGFVEKLTRLFMFCCQKCGTAGYVRATCTTCPAESVDMGEWEDAKAKAKAAWPKAGPGIATFNEASYIAKHPKTQKHWTAKEATKNQTVYVARPFPCMSASATVAGGY